MEEGQGGGGGKHGELCPAGGDVGADMGKPEGGEGTGGDGVDAEGGEGVDGFRGGEEGGGEPAKEGNEDE